MHVIACFARCPQFQGNFSAKPDRYYSIRYYLDGKLKEEGLGWSSEGWTPQKALDERYKIRLAIKEGKEVRTRAEAREAREKKVQAKKRLLELEIKDRIAFNEVWDPYFVQAQNNKKKGSWRRERSLYRNWIEPELGHRPLKSIAPTHLERIKSNMRKAELADATIKYALATIRQVFNWARDNGKYDGGSPTKKVKIPKVDNQRIRFLSEHEAANILKLLHDQHEMVYEMVLVSLDHGLRKGEVCNLEWGDVDLDMGWLDIKNTKSKKTRKAYLTSRAKQLFSSKVRGKPSEHVFPGSYDHKAQLVTKVFNGAVNELGLNDGIKDHRQKVVFHTLRHTFASWHAMEGTPMTTLRDLLGHCNLSMVSRYTHLADKQLAQSASVIEGKVVPHTIGKDNPQDQGQPPIPKRSFML